MNAMGDYHELYLKTDVLLLADIFGKFISTCLEHYGLFPCHYFSSSRLSFDIILKMRGGIPYIAKRHSKANNKHMKSYYDNKPRMFIMYLDAINL